MFSAGFDCEIKDEQIVHRPFMKRAERNGVHSSPCEDFVHGFDSEYLPVSSLKSRLGTKGQQSSDNSPRPMVGWSSRAAALLQASDSGVFINKSDRNA